MAKIRQGLGEKGGRGVQKTESEKKLELKREGRCLHDGSEVSDSKKGGWGGGKKKRENFGLRAAKRTSSKIRELKKESKQGRKKGNEFNN